VSLENNQVSALTKTVWTKAKTLYKDVDRIYIEAKIGNCLIHIGADNPLQKLNITPGTSVTLFQSIVTIKNERIENELRF
jgi:hypothetical protein